MVYGCKLGGVYQGGWGQNNMVRFRKVNTMGDPDNRTVQ